MQFSYFSIALFSVLFWMTCDGTPPPAATDTASPFYVDDASYLYFKNLRVKDYTLEERQTPRVDIYRHRQLAAPAEGPGLQIALIDNWLQDEAYLQIDWVGEDGRVSGPLELTPRFGGDTTATYRVGSGRPADALAFARALQAGARSQRVLNFETDDGETTADLEIKLADFGPQLTTVQDYLRLIDG